jgi:hypothetical protein
MQVVSFVKNNQDSIVHQNYHILMLSKKPFYKTIKEIQDKFAKHLVFYWQSAK